MSCIQQIIIFPPLTCSACGMVATATVPSQEGRCSTSTGLLDLWSHSSLHMAIWENQSHRNMPPILPFASLLIILPHYTRLRRRQGVIFLVSACFSVIDGQNIKQEVSRSDETNVGGKIKWMLSRRQRHTSRCSVFTKSISSKIPHSLFGTC